jgi:hypothetical protein
VNNIDGSALTKHIKKAHKSDLKFCRHEKSYKSIPESHYTSLNSLGRCKYRAIVISTFMSQIWDGWKPKAKSKRVPDGKVMITRRMLHQHFKISESTSRN